MIPQLSTGEVAAESDVYSHLCIERALREIEPSFLYYWLRQDDLKRVKDRPGMMHLFDELPAGFYNQMAMVNLGRLVDLFSWQRGLYPVECVFTSRAGVAPLLSLALADMAGQFPVPIVLTEPRVYGPGERGHNQVHPTQLALRAAGYATCWGMYWSTWERDSAIEAASLYCSPAVIKAMEERAFVVDALVDVAGIVHEIQRTPSPKRLAFMGRINSNKRFPEILEAYGKVLMARQDVSVWVHAGTGAFDKVGPAAEHRWHATSERLPRKEFWQLMGSVHVGAYLSFDEGANVTTQEMLASGIVLALPDRTWVHKQFHPHRYPYLVKNERELPGLLDWLLDHYDEAYQALTPIRELIATRGWPGFLSKFRRVYDAVRSVPAPPPFRVFRTLVDQELARRGGDAVLPFSSAIAQNPRWQTSAPQFSEARSVRACYAAVRDLDDMTAADPRLVAPKEATT